MPTQTKQQNKKEELRLDLVNNAPLPNSRFENITLLDVKNIEFINTEGTFMKVESYEVGIDKTLVIILK